MKIDPYKHEEQFERWLNSINGKKRVDGLNEINSTLLSLVIIGVLLDFFIYKSCRSTIG
ncbi:MAG: hypothetical protein IH845_03085 [Nanoarchaeota archaeon]|nr:hypothetical protein [Nanoarchaeota archaeon]